MDLWLSTLVASWNHLRGFKKILMSRPHIKPIKSEFLGEVTMRADTLLGIKSSQITQGRKGLRMPSSEAGSGQGRAVLWGLASFS